MAKVKMNSKELKAFSHVFYVLYSISYIDALRDFPHVSCNLEGLCTRMDLK